MAPDGATINVKTGHDKLVRDRVPELLAARGIRFEARIADEAELPGLLQAKLREEVAEYLAADDDRERVRELADVLEVTLALAALHGADPDSIERLRANKALERGSFAAGFVLVAADADGTPTRS